MANRRVRLGWVGDYVGLYTGFATVGLNVLKGLHETGNYEIFHLGSGLGPDTLLKYLKDNGQLREYIATIEKIRGSSDPWSLDYSPLPYPYKLVPMVGSHFGQDCLFPFIKRFELDACIFLYDPWMTAWTVLSGPPHPCPFIYYQPIDAVGAHGGLPALRSYEGNRVFLVGWEKVMAMQEVSVVYGEWGRNLVLNSFDFWFDSKDFLPYLDLFVIRHGVDTDLFTPIDKKVARNMMGIKGDGFIVLSVMANQPRKDWEGFFRIVKGLIDRGIPARAMPWTNIIPSPNYQGSSDIEWMAITLGVKDLIYPPSLATNAVPRATMPYVMNAGDAHVLQSAGEGCGLPLIEAAACGIPSFAVNATGTVDYFAHDKQKIPVASWFMDVGNCLLRPRGDIQVAIEKLAEVYYEPERTRKWVEQARKRVQEWTWRSTIKDWENVINFALENKERLLAKREKMAEEKKKMQDMLTAKNVESEQTENLSVQSDVSEKR